jgi:hypothetical protein
MAPRYFDAVMVNVTMLMITVWWVRLCVFCCSWSVLLYAVVLQVRVWMMAHDLVVIKNCCEIQRSENRMV